VGSGAEAKVEAVEEAQAGLWSLVVGSVSSGVFAIIIGTRLFASDLVSYFRFGDGVSGFDLLLSPALFGIGHLIGLWVGLAMFAGELIAWLWGVPHFSAGLLDPNTHVETLASNVWRHQVRFVGAGTILVAALWTLAKLVAPVYSGMRATLHASRASRTAGHEGALPSTERDLPMGIIALMTLICLAPIPFLLARFDVTGALGGHITALVVGGMIYIILVSFLVSSVCGYMAGLIGSSNSPLSGIGILGTIGAALLLAFSLRSGLSAEGQHALVAYALFVTSVIFAVAAIANNNLQDLKTGQLVNATPWKQQVALFVGVIAGAVIIPPVLDLLNHAYGFAGAPGPVREHALPAPQAGLMAALAQGVLQGNVDWSLIEVGVGIGVGMILIDMLIRRLVPGAHLSPLAVGLGIYLPTSATMMVVVGSVVGWLFDRRADRRPNAASVKQLGVLLASGLIVGEGLVGVLIAAWVAFSGKDYPAALVGDDFANGPALWLGPAAFAIAVVLLYRWVARLRR
jgi:putative OPT family oligopeptide transporter